MVRFWSNFGAMATALGLSKKKCAVGKFNRPSLFPPRILAGESPVNDETRKAAVLNAAAIFAARALSDWDGKRSPKAVSAVANAIEKAQLLVATLEAKAK